ncbi:MAG: VWA domain-containing protein [Desulfobulbaceae bacterium]|nr:VWA domain-containing protein [Desulfobulbaceae bacterium]
MLSFAWPWAFLLLPLPLLVYFGMPRAGREEPALLVPFFREVAALTPRPVTRGGGQRTGLLLLLVLIWFLLVSAGARPQWLGGPAALPAVGRDLMLAVDISGSMAQEDMVIGMTPVARLDLVKKVVGDFLARRVGDRVGLLLFGTEAYLQAPLTFDRQTVKTLLNEALIGFAGKKTSLGDAIMLAVKHLKDRPAASRVLILLTDGSNTAGNIAPLTAADLAAQSGVRIYTVGVGAAEMVVRTFFGNQRVNPAADLDEPTLAQIAAATSGRYFRARDSAELEKIYQVIDQLEPVAQESEIYRPVQSLYYWPLAGALALSFLVALLLVAGELPHLGRRR